MVAEKDNKRYYDMNFHFKAAQNFVAEHYGTEFGMKFHFNAAQRAI